MSVDKKALKESISDTAIASFINLPLNYVLIGFCFWMDMTALEMSFFMTAVFTVLAVVRKYYVRLYFARRNVYGKTKKSETHQEENQDADSRT